MCLDCYWKMTKPEVMTDEQKAPNIKPFSYPNNAKLFFWEKQDKIILIHQCLANSSLHSVVNILEYSTRKTLKGESFLFCTE